VYVRCETCGQATDTTLLALALWRPEGRRFWSEHSTVRVLGEREVESGGRVAIITSFGSVAGRARFDAPHARDTYEFISLQVTPGS
jgi:hypothetical protein